ncbi:hypothetical protein BGX27_007255 [Mortierella sp. AM989]|nr:hypothetical protein BGX27_007255 [Mortierella sp. AM989]
MTPRPNICVSNIIKEYKVFLQHSNTDVPCLKNVIGPGLKPFLQLAGNRLGDTLQMHYQGHISELVKCIEEYNHSWAIEEGRSILADIDEDGKSELEVYDSISLFWILNSHLPTPKQFKSSPEDGFQVKFFTITEESLLKVLLSGQLKYLKDYLKDTFKSQKDALMHSAEHPGELIYRGKNIT